LGGQLEDQHAPTVSENAKKIINLKPIEIDNGTEIESPENLEIN